MFTCSLSSLLDPSACQVGGKKIPLHALEETSLVPHEPQERAQGGGRIPSEGRKGDKPLLPWGSLPRMGVVAVVWWRIEINKLIGIEIHRILTKFMIHLWNGTWFLGTWCCCCQRLALLAKPLKCWTLAGLDGKNKHTVKEILAYPAMLLLKPLKVKFSFTLVASCS